jgi:site-specific recombinase XerD
MAAGTLWQDHGLIFASEVGTPMDPDNFSHSFARLCERAGLGHWHPHELRHSGASLMLAQGTPLYVVSEVPGHAHRHHQKTCTGICSKATSGRQQSR